MSLDEAYRRGMADYEAALVAQAQQQAASPEAYYYQGLVDYEQALLQQASVAQMASGASEASYLQGMADYEALLLQQQQQQQAVLAAQAAGGGSTGEEAYALGLIHYEIELLAGTLAEAVKGLSADHKTAYERGRADYESALKQQRSQQPQPTQPSAQAAEEPQPARPSTRGGRKRAARG